MIRKASFSGSFYPSSPDEIRQYIEHFEKIAVGHFDAMVWKDISVSAIVVPHAGYVYSGFTAHLAFQVLQQKAPETVVVIGPSHHHYFQGVSVASLDSYETPLGDLEIDAKVVNLLKERFQLQYIPDAHAEHSTEVQMPFVKYYHPAAKVVELVYGDTTPDTLEPIVEYLLTLKGVIVVISTDLSHFYTLKEANYLDTVCIDAFQRLDHFRLHEGCEACGIIGLEAMMRVASSKGYQTKLLDYRTSADASGDTDRVVGYMSGLFVSK